MSTHIRPAVVLTLLLCALTGLVYPGLVTGLAQLLFPWQALLITHEHYPTYLAKGDEVTALDVGPQPAFKVPGVLYTWRELESDYDFPKGVSTQSALKWGRFVAFPLLALVILMMVQTKSSRGLRFALGEADVHVDVSVRRRRYTSASTLTFTFYVARDRPTFTSTQTSTVRRSPPTRPSSPSRSPSPPAPCPRSGR
jgi:hypothetical protein